MKNFYRNLLIKQKLVLMITVTSAITLLLAFGAFAIKNIAVFKEKQVSKFSILAKILADNSEAALSFNDPNTAEELLSSLKAEPHLTFASLYNNNGKRFASFGDAPAFIPVSSLFSDLHYFERGYLNVFWPIVLDSQRLGFVYLKLNTGELTELFRSYLVFGLILMMACVAAAILIASRFQKSISLPVTHLTQLAEDVSKDKNYSLRAAKYNNDELGTLVERFNDMLSEIQKREGALVLSNDALLQSNRDLEQFAYVASHDLQEPLRIVVNYVELLSKQWDVLPSAQRKQFMDYVTEGAKQSQQLIRDLLEYSRVRREGKMELVNSDGLLNKALDHLKYSIQSSNATVTHDTLPMIYADPIKMTQLFQNLIANALKFKKNEAPRIHISAVAKDNEWIFSVQDNGIGIAPEYNDQIFVIFKRLHTRDAYSGTGIGLAICKRILEQHNGKIWVKSAENEGSTFYFSLPMV
jgi:signal transduction histidine kinase